MYDDRMTDASSRRHPGQLRHLGLLSATGICVASMIGSGIFAVPGQVGPALATPSNVIAAWALAAILAAAGAMTVAEVAAMRPRVGATYHAAQETLGARWGFLNGLVTVLVGYFAANAFIAGVLGTYVHLLLPAVDPLLAATVFVAGLTAIHALTTITGARWNDLLVVLKVAIVGVFIVAGFLIDIPTAPSPLATGAIDPSPGFLPGVVGAAMVGISFAYLGWAAVSDVAGEVKRPAKVLPRAIIGSVTFVAVIYILMNIVFMRFVEPSAMVEADGTPMANIGGVVAGRMLGPVGGQVMSGAILLLLLSTLSTGIFVGGRILVAMASRGELPAALGRRRGNGAPTAAILLQGVITLIFLWSAGLSALLQYIGLLTIICASMSSFAVIIYRRRGVSRPWSMPLYPVPVVIALGLTGWAVYSSIVDQPWPAVASIATMVAVVLVRPLLIRRTGSTIGADCAESVDTAPRDRTS